MPSKFLHRAGPSGQAGLLLRTHIEASKAVARDITLHRLHTARPRALSPAPRKTRAA